MSKKYDFKQIEKKWQKKWRAEKVYEPSFAQGLRTGKPNLKSAGGRIKKPFYNLMMFPYPSAEGLHVGNMYAFTGADIYGRLKRMQGYDVFEPIGLDGFGIHSENYALKIGTHPAKQSKISEKRFYKQLASIGNGFAWNEHLETYDPEYYKWTQWIFAEMFKKGLAYRKKQAVNWCPSCKTVLADEQVLQVSSIKYQVSGTAGVCERCGTEVFKKELEQWFFRITKYADRLLKDLNPPVGGLDWSERVKIAQENWIGKSEGALICFNVVNVVDVLNGQLEQARRSNKRGDQTGRAFIEVFTTRPDTLFGATYLVLAPEHEQIAHLRRGFGGQADSKSSSKGGSSLGGQITNWREVEDYIKKAKAKSDEERISEGRDLSTGSGQAKTGVELKGVKAINPANGEEIPIWVADYVLGSYGTGAIMAVPAHDGRDFEFAKKFNLPIKEVVAPDFGEVRPNEQNVQGVTVIGYDRASHKFLGLKWKDRATWLVGGGKEEGESFEDAARRELVEETGYSDIIYLIPLGALYSHYYNDKKNINRRSFTINFLAILNKNKQGKSNLETHENFTPEWYDIKNLREEITKVGGGVEHWLEVLNRAEEAIALYEVGKIYEPQGYVDAGVMINSGKFDGMNSEKAKWEITKFVGGERKIQYRLRDWLISRQRYWGPPIPLVFCENCAESVRCHVSGIKQRKNVALRQAQGDFTVGEIENPGWVPVPDDKLPVKLPLIKNFKPLGTGKSPLATDPKFYKTKCPRCGGPATRETDVSDTFLDSAWYYLGYLMQSQRSKGKSHKSNSKVISPWNKKLADRWLPIDLYTGGAEHSVLHLLYVRFLAKVFHDWGLVDFSSKGGSASGGDEPAKKFRAHGLLIKDGTKMSKSKGNVINPDEYIEKFGADTLRMYLMFLAPFEQGGDFRDSGILGVERFLNRVWKLYSDTNIPARLRLDEVHAGGRMHANDANNTNFDRLLNKTIKKVTEDIETLNYNTAVSAMMILLNEMEKHEKLSVKSYASFVKLLAPFAPHMAEELWQSQAPRTRASSVRGRQIAKRKSQKKFKSIHTEEWPKYDPKKIKDEKFTLVIQINGRVRDSVEVEAGISQVEAEKLVLEREKVKVYLGGAKPKKVIFVPGRLINFVV